jgi:GNAT superfamily N-acetyltransferase
MTSLTFHPAKRYKSGALSELFTRAYTDYAVPVQLDAAGFESMEAANDIDLSASRVGVLGKATVAIALLGVRGRCGWIGGMGVVPQRRGQRIGLAAMQAVIESARRIELRSIDLEVLTDNLPAIHIYDALGFKRRRILDIWTRGSDSTFPMPPPHEVQTLEVQACLKAFDDLHAVIPPWQRDLPYLERAAASLHALGTVEQGRIKSYLLYRMEGPRVNILDAAAAAGQRTAAIEALLRALIRDRAGSPLRLVNLPQDDPASDAMHRVGAEIERQQNEMTLDL